MGIIKKIKTFLAKPSIIDIYVHEDNGVFATIEKTHLCVFKTLKDFYDIEVGEGFIKVKSPEVGTIVRFSYFTSGGKYEVQNTING